MMLRLSLAVALLLAGCLLGAVSAQTGLPPHLALGGRLSPHPKNCAAGHVWFSAEEWWRRELAPVPDAARDFGHVHNEMCWPQLLELSAPTPVQITSLAHQNPGRVVRLGVQSEAGRLRSPGAVGDGCTPDGDDEMGVEMACRNTRAANRTAWRCIETGGTIAMASADPATTPPTCKWADSLTIDPAVLLNSGATRLRTRVIMDQPSDIVNPPRGLRHARALFSGTVVIANGGAPIGQGSANDPELNVLRGTGWGTGTNYTATRLWGAPKLPVGGLWRPWMHVARGSPTSVQVARHVAQIDMNAHEDKPGTVLKNDTGVFNGQLPIQTASLTPGWRKLTIQGKAVDPATGATNTGSLAVLFEVVSGAPAACGVPIQTHAAADSTLFSTIVTTVRTSGALPIVKIKPNVRASTPMMELRRPATTSTPTRRGGTHTVSTASFARLSYPLDWLAPGTPLAAASVYLYVRSGTGMAQVVALDADVADPVSSLPSRNAVLGGGIIGGAGTWLEVKLDAAKVAEKLAAGQPLNLALTIESDAGPFLLAASASKGAPPLLLTPACAPQ